MALKWVLLTAFTAVASALPGLLHDESHHTHEVLDNIHNTPHCAYTCIFDDNMARRWAPECKGLEGIELGACYCRADPYQYMLDQCIDLRCGSGGRQKVSINRR